MEPIYLQLEIVDLDILSEAKEIKEEEQRIWTIELFVNEEQD